MNGELYVNEKTTFYSNDDLFNSWLLPNWKHELISVQYGEQYLQHGKLTIQHEKFSIQHGQLSVQLELKKWCL